MKTTTTRLVSLLAVALLCTGQPAAGDEAANIYLITQSEVTIEAGPAEIWPYIIDTSEWKTLATSETVAGTAGEFGEKQIVRGGEGAAAYQFWTETIELIPEKRKVIAIYFDEQAKTDISYAAWTLFPAEDRTMVTYDVYAVSRIPGVAADQVAAVREQATAPNRTRFQEELWLLKSLVEGAR